MVLNPLDRYMADCADHASDQEIFFLALLHHLRYCKFCNFCLAFHGVNFLLELIHVASS